MMHKFPLTLGRRDFIKIKFFFTLYAYLSQFMRLKSTKTVLHTKQDDYRILDKLLELPFSPVVKKEVVLRVHLQKRYCTDSNGCLHPLDRFLREIVHFILYHKDERDFDLLHRLKNKQIDYNYLVKTLVKLDEAKSLKKVQTKLISADDEPLKQLLYEAIRSKSFKSTMHLLQLQINLDAKTKKAIQTLVSKQEYHTFYHRLARTMQAEVLPNLLEYKPTQKREIKRLESNPYAFTKQEYIENLYIAVHNTICELYLHELIDDYSLTLSNSKVSVSVWNHSNSYRVDFMQIFESYLLENGFQSWDNQLHEYLKTEYEATIEDVTFYKEKNNTNIHHREKTDYYEFIELEVL
jgi:hypothetical protein